MGWTRNQLTPEVIKAMSVKDRARYAPGVHASTYQEDENPPNKTGSLERKEQADFAFLVPFEWLPHRLARHPQEIDGHQGNP